MSCDQAFDKLSEKPNSRLSVQEEYDFQKGGTMCPPLAQELKKKPGLQRVKEKEGHHSIVALFMGQRLISFSRGRLFDYLENNFITQIQTLSAKVIVFGCLAAASGTLLRGELFLELEMAQF